ncbi:Fur family transcriptional regulator [Halovulum sp. GXIMD14793]
MNDAPAGSSAFTKHDHQRCISDAIAAAEARATARGLRLTPARRRVLEILLEDHRAMGAYEVLERLHAEGQPAQPPVAYRALDFLRELGIVHRIHRLNAFIACSCPDHSHSAAFLICRACDRVEETPLAADLLPETGGFQVDMINVEATGLCATCQSAR